MLLLAAERMDRGQSSETRLFQDLCGFGSFEHTHFGGCGGISALSGGCEKNFVVSSEIESVSWRRSEFSLSQPYRSRVLGASPARSPDETALFTK